ncbi:reverse transcriptase domain-containing protein, partial [Geminicoccus harenae]|uniref:reverse transcriptase domain-containing protein n=1 Tax=Geminicoccus harenae TaxID=2498453 RepID=UPI001C949600
NAINSIKCIARADGSLSEDPDTIKNEAVSFFQSILGSDPGSPDDSGMLNNLEGFRWSQDHVDILNRGITAEEIKSTIFSIKNDKAPGPDGFSSLFFKKAWDVVGADVIEAITSFFSSGCMLREINCTIIALVPKVPNPSSFNEFRPIACCNVVYKCISKIIANRLKLCIPDIISPFQSAFVHGRIISDNILLTQEIMHNYHRDVGPPRCA